MKRRRGNGADDVVAATAGVDNWKTWAGRGHGSDDFEALDLFRGMKRSIRNRFFIGPPPKGTQCPVCFCEADEWHITSSCGHAVCVDCFKAYASSQVRDKDQSGPLRCPVCPQVLRKSDAIAALKDDKSLLKEWDRKIRNQLLRALPSYRSCPKCSDDPKSEATGGGFVTSECLAPQYTSRRQEAMRRRVKISAAARAAIFLWCSFLLRHIAVDPSRSPVVDIFFMLATVFIYIVRPNSVLRSCDHAAATWARDALFKPISVECPCCSFEFVLPATSTIRDQETKEWLKSNSRLCPSCSAPITKNGGCNHMQCFHCKAKFCWACMRLRSNCKAYECVNGGVNASPFQRDTEQRTQDSLVGWIDRTLESENAKIRPRELIVYHFFLFFMRDSAPIALVVDWIISMVTSLLSTEFVMLIFLIVTVYAGFPRRRMPQNALDLQQQNMRNRFQGVADDAMLAEAIRRSMVET